MSDQVRGSSMTELDVAWKVHAVSTFPSNPKDKNADINGAELFLQYHMHHNVWVFSNIHENTKPPDLRQGVYKQQSGC